MPMRVVIWSGVAGGAGRKSSPSPAYPPYLPSGQRLLRELVALLHLFGRRPGSAVLVFDVRGDRPAFFLQRLQHFANRRLALSPGHVVPLVLPAILEMQVGDVGLV